MCVGYRQLNPVTEPDVLPMGRTDNLWLQVKNASYITVIDMLCGYWQMPLNESAQGCTAFVTHQGHYAWRVMPYDHHNSVSTF